MSKKINKKGSGDTGNSPTVSFVITKQMSDRLTEEAWRQRMSKSALIRMYISEGLKYVPRNDHE